MYFFSKYFVKKVKSDLILRKQQTISLLAPISHYEEVIWVCGVRGSNLSMQSDTYV